MAARVMVTAPPLRRFALLLLALLHQQLISEHLPDDLLGLGFGLLLELAKAGLLKENDAGAPMFPPSGPQPLTGRGRLPPMPLLRPVPHNVTILSQSKTKRKATADPPKLLLVGRT